MKSKPTPPAFPLETLFPGIHKTRPDIAAQEAEMFLAHGTEATGYTIEEARKEFKVPPGQFLDFQIDPVPPPFDERLASIPDDWYVLPDRPDVIAQVETFLCDFERAFGMPDHLYATILDPKQLWIRLKP